MPYVEIENESPCRRGGSSYALWILMCFFLVGCQSETSDIRVSDAWAWPVHVLKESEEQPDTYTGAVYLTLENRSKQDDTLIGAFSDVAQHVEMHRSILDEKGVVRMRGLPEVELPGGTLQNFEPGGSHFMLIGLTQSLETGDIFTLTLHFKQSPTQSIQVHVKP